MRIRPLVLLLALALAGAAAGYAQVKRVTRPLLRPNPYKGMRFFPALKWRVTLGMPADTTPALADLDLDGRMDLIVPAADGKLYRLTEDGAVKWKVELPGTPSAGVTLGDVDRDGALDILVAADKTLLCFDADGKERWRFEATEEIHSFATVADLDGDGKPEVVFGANDNRLHVLDGKGVEKWSFETKSWVVGGAAVADLDGDGRLEVVFGSMDFNVYCLDAAGKERWHFATEDWVQSSPCIGDVDHDGQRDVVVGSDDGHVYCLSRGGNLKWKEAVSGQQRMKPYLALADLDGDGTLETVACLPSGQISVLTGFGDKAWTRSVGSAVRASPVVADLNGDGWQDILVVTESGQMTALDTWGGTHWNHLVGSGIEATPLIADVNRNGKYEIYVANVMGAEHDRGFLSQYELSVTGGKGLWTSLKGDPYRTGYVPNARDYAAALRKGSDYATAWEPFLAGYRPRTGVTPPRRLRITALAPNDVVGNHDGALDPGESAIWKVQVTNDGRGASYDSLLSVDLGRSALHLDRTQCYLGWIAPRATKTVTFRLTAPSLSRAMQYGGYRQLVGSGTARMQVKESGVQAAVSEARVIHVPALPPVLRMTERKLLDGVGALTFGNGNGRLDSGETAVLRLVLRNENLTTARDATVRLTSGSSDVLVATPLAVLKGVVPYGTRQVDIGLRTAQQLHGRSVVLTLTTQPAGAPAHVERMRLPLGQGAVDVQPPTLALTSPTARISTTRQAHAVIAGTLSDGSDVTGLRFDKQVVPMASLQRVGPNRYRFRLQRDLKVGENVFPITATDGAGNSLNTWVRIVRKP